MLLWIDDVDMIYERPLSLCGELLQPCPHLTYCKDKKICIASHGDFNHYGEIWLSFSSKDGLWNVELFGPHETIRKVMKG